MENGARWAQLLATAVDGSDLAGALPRGLRPDGAVLRHRQARSPDRPSRRGVDTLAAVATWIPPDNIPAPVTGSRVALLQDERSQMSFGERAALHGLLSQLGPRLSLEVGTYDGGSLRAIAAHSGHVHTLDLYALVPDRESFGNVTFHVGDSRDVLPRLLTDLADAGETIDFALVDGDHSTEGVRADVELLLASEAAATTVIVLHDTMNPEVRAGIEQAGIEAHPRVVYFEPDFVPGYEFRGGHFGGQVWGGLGLIVTGSQRPEGYATSVRQTRYVEAFADRARASAVASEAERLRHEVGALREQLAWDLDARRRLEASVSWRLTAPLRAAKRRVRR